MIRRNSKKEFEEIVLVSACLIGIPCRYDGDSSFKESLLKELIGKIVVSVCPELMGGMGVPRVPFELPSLNYDKIFGGEEKIMNKEDEDITEKAINGCLKVLEVCKALGIEKAYLKENSPSCGVNQVYINGVKNKGMGICAYLLKKNDIIVIGE